MQTPTQPFKAPRIDKSQTRIVVEQILEENTKRGGINPVRIAEIMGIAVSSVRAAINPLRDTGAITNVGTQSKPMYVMSRVAQTKQRVAVKYVPSGCYDGAELRPFDGRPGAMDAYSLPSLRDGQRYPYNGIRPQLVGSLKDNTNNAR